MISYFTWLEQNYLHKLQTDMIKSVKNILKAFKEKQKELYHH